MKKFISLFTIFVLSVNIVFASNVSPTVIQSRQINETLFNYGKITDSYCGSGKSVVIWVQDLHNDPAVQNNIYNILNILSQNSDAEIYLEGAARGEFDTSVFKAITDKKLRNISAKNLLAKGILSGSEYYAVVNDNVKIYGLENEDTYKNNLKNLELINSQKQFNNYIVSKIADSVNSIKKRYILNSILAAENINLKTISLTDLFPNLQRQQSVLKIFDKIDYSELNKQINKLLTDSSQNISSDNYAELSKFISSNSNYGYAKAYDYIQKNMPDFNSQRKDLFLFLKANKTLLEINPVSLLYERDLLKRQVLASEDLNRTEKEIFDLDYFSGLLNNLVNSTISPAQYSELKNNKNYAENLYAKYLPSVIKNFAVNLLNNDTFFNFCDTNLERNAVFVNNINYSGDGIKIVVAGGFHSGITDILKKENKSYIVITPEISSNNAFNQLFISGFQEGTDAQIIDNFFSVIEKWGIFFTDAESFQNELTNWTRQIAKLKDMNIKVLDVKEGFLIDVTYNDTNKYKTFSYDAHLEPEKTAEDFNPSKKQVEQTLKMITRIARKSQFFGEKTTVTTNNDNSLFDSSVLLPVRVISENGENKISINKSFLNALAVQDESLTETVVHLLYFYSSLDKNTDLFQQFITNNYNKLQEIYSINRQLQSINKGFFSAIKNKIKAFINKFAALFSQKQTTSYEKLKKLSQIYQTPEQQYMIEALKQAELAKQSRKFLKTFFQPPVGAFIVNDDGFTGQAYNQDNSVLHAETLTFISFLKNCIVQEELMPDGELSTKGKQLYSLLELAFLNGQNIGNKIFQNRPLILENIGINIEYPEKRTIDDVFNETNLVLKFVDDQMDNPLRTASLYCTLTPCNKCIKTMATLGIEKLAYGSSAVNKNHHGIENLLKNGIIVEDNILENETDKYILNYKLMNSSMLRTKIASFIQTIRRSVSSIFNKPNKRIKERMYSDILSLGLERTVEMIKDFQTNIDWNRFIQDNDLSKLQIFLNRMGAWENPLKRAGMIYVLKNNITAFTENGNIYFKDKNGKRFNFYINSNGQFAASNEYMTKMGVLAKVKNFADMDDNLALRKSELNEEMSVIYSTLNLYGIAQPIIITGNTLDETNLRLKPLGSVINSIMPELYIENAAMEYKYSTDGSFTENTKYSNDIAKSYIEESTISDIKTTMAKVKSEWYKLFTDFASDTREIRKKTDLSYKEMVEAATANNKHSEPLNFLMARAGIEVKDKSEFLAYYGSLSRDQAMNEINKFYNLMMIINISEEQMLNVMETLSVLEMSRLYLSKDPADVKERNSVIIDIKKVDNNEQIRTEFQSNVRVAVSPVRPTLVRIKVADYYNRKIQQKYPGIITRSAGQTTITIYKKDINKIIPVEYAILRGTPSEYIIYTGDEFNSAGVDYPLYQLQQQRGNEQMVVINTNGQQFDGTFISLSSLPGFSKQVDSISNINRSIALQNKIIEIIEDNIGKIAVDSAFKPDNVAQELKNRILSPSVIEINSRPKMKDIEDLLKAG